MPSAQSPGSPPVPRPPAADLPVDAERVRALTRQLVPEPGVDLGEVRWALGPSALGEGWDNVLWPVGTLTGRSVVLRVVRRASALALMRSEVVVTRHLRTADEPLAMRVPAPLATADGAALIPWIPGVIAAETDAQSRLRTAHQLARMLAIVHSLGPPSIELNPVRGVPVATRAEAFARDLERAGVSASGREVAEDLWARGIEAPAWAGEALLLHGDPHPGNVVVPGQGPAGLATADQRSALIDWGDATTGDPASDLGALLLHDPSGAASETYRSHARWRGIESDDVWNPLHVRAAAWGARLALTLLTAYDRDHPLGRVGQRFLDR